MQPRQCSVHAQWVVLGLQLRNRAHPQARVCALARMRKGRFTRLLLSGTKIARCRVLGIIFNYVRAVSITESVDNGEKKKISGSFEFIA